MLTWSELALTGCLRWLIIGTVILSLNDTTELLRSIINLTEHFPKASLSRAKYLYTLLTSHSNLSLSQGAIRAVDYSRTVNVYLNELSLLLFTTVK